MRGEMFSKKGFTLIEILMVVVIISILGGIVMAASSYMTRLSRSKRLAVTKTVLETAIYRYRAEYGDWPLPSGKENDDSEEIVISGEDNKEVFGALRMASDRNPDRIQFIDETTILAWDKNRGQVLPLAQTDRKKDMPLVYIDGNGKYKSSGGTMNYFTVKIHTVDETVKVETR